MPDREEMGEFHQYCSERCTHCNSGETWCSSDPLDERAHCETCGSYFTRWDVYKRKHKRNDGSREMSDMFMSVLPTLCETVDKEWPW